MSNDTTHFDGETLLGSETKDEVWVGEFKRGFRGDEGNGERCGDPTGIMATFRKTGFGPSYGIVTRTGSRRERGKSLDNSAQRHSYLRTSSLAD